MLALTPGEPAGIGPDIALSLVGTPLAQHVVIVACPDLLNARASHLGLDIDLVKWHTNQPRASLGSKQLYVLPTQLRTQSTPGILNQSNAGYVLATLDTAIDGCIQGHFDGMVTGPVHKGIINNAGIPFSGHTEYLAAKTATKRVVMMLANSSLRVSLASTHLPLKDVPTALTADVVRETIQITHRDLTQKFGIKSPKLLLCGLNPHAGEDGHMGREEIEVINPVARELQQQGIDVSEATPADTAFTSQRLRDVDAVIAMYHDQGLPVLKAQGFGETVNITLGLPIVRTSVDHGTALDLAGKDAADNGSLLAAITSALAMTAKAI